MHDGAFASAHDPRSGTIPIRGIAHRSMEWSMGDRISGSNETIVNQAQVTAEGYLAAAVKAVDHHLGTGAAATWPQLVAAYMLTAAVDFGASIIARAIETQSDDH